MEPNLFLYLFIAMAATAIGAVPLGLVNLSVLDLALKNDTRSATQIAHGASVVEVFFALASLLAGAKLTPFFEGNPVVRYFVFAVLLVAGLFFWFKTNKEKIRKEAQKSYGFLKGALLNIVSIQVLLFWLLAATVLSAKQWLPTTFPEVLLFLSGVWLAKIGVLKGYAFLAKKVATHADKFSANTNRIIGVVLLAVAIVQLIKI
ncbi:MAG: LysE family translocator [Mariniphaga sp.]|nr:LysE family translocator [Mariniphaga sp.]